MAKTIDGLLAQICALLHDNFFGVFIKLNVENSPGLGSLIK